MQLARPGMDNILLLGCSKSGTTGLYTAVKSACHDAGHRVHAVFEPKRAADLDNLFLLAPRVPVLTKLTMDKVSKALPDPAAFDRRIMIVRDPRDILVSALLFRPLTARAIRRSSNKAVEQFVAALRRKEADPASLSVRQLFELAGSLGLGNPPYTGIQNQLARQQRLLNTHEFHTVRYEQFVSNELDGLSSYLGFAVRNVTDVGSSTLGHIARSKSAGGFRHWFRADDLTYFNQMFGDLCSALGYELVTELHPHPVIDPATSSDYVQRSHERRRATLSTIAESRDRGWSPELVDSPDALDQLESLASDGNAQACMRVAQVALSPHLGGPDQAKALHWARTAAQLGVRGGIKMTINLLEQTMPHDPAAHRELRAWRAAYAMQAPGTPSRELKRVKALEREVARMRQSTQWQLGGQLVRFARDPRRNGLKAARGLVTIWRNRARRQAAWPAVAGTPGKRSG